MDTEINSTDKSVSIDDINLEKILNDEIIIGNLSEISSDNEINVHNNYEETISETDLNTLPQINDDTSNNDEYQIDNVVMTEINIENIINIQNEVNAVEIVNDEISVDINNLAEINTEKIINIEDEATAIEIVNDENPVDVNTVVLNEIDINNLAEINTEKIINIENEATAIEIVNDEIPVDVNTVVLDEIDINNLPEINIEKIINIENEATAIEITVSTIVSDEIDINNLPEINLEQLVINKNNDDLNKPINNEYSAQDKLENNTLQDNSFNGNNHSIVNQINKSTFCLDNKEQIQHSHPDFHNIHLENTNDKLEDEYSLDINERIIHNHGFIEQETFENKLNLDSEFYISKELTLAHNLEFTNSNDELTKIEHLSNDNLDISVEDNNFKNINITNLDGLIVNNLLDNTNQHDDKSNNNYVIEGTQFINGTIENSYILGSTLSNVIFEGKMNNINKIDYSTSLFNGKISTVKAGVNIEEYQCVECYISSGNLFVRPTNPLSSSPFFGIAQSSVLEGDVVEVLTEGISYINVKKSIELPILKRVANQLIFATDNKNNVFKQNLNLNIEKDDIVVLTGSANDILIGPSSKYFQFNNVNTHGTLSLYKSIQINFQSGSYILNDTNLQNYKLKKTLRNNEFITVLDVDTNGRIIGLLN